MATSDLEGNNRSAEDIERELEQTRSRISRTIDAIQHKITPGQLATDAYGYVQGNGTEFAKNLGVAAKNNPVPIALMSIGLAWLMMGRDGTAAYLRGNPSRHAGGYARSVRGAAQSAGETASGVGERIGEMASGASDRVREMADDVRDLASEWREGAAGLAGDARVRMHRAGESVQEQTTQMRDQASQLLNEQPLVAGALGLAVGAILGALLPLSRRENEMMGETRDQLLDQAKEMGQQTLGEATEAARGVADAAAEAAFDEADRRGLTASGSDEEGDSEPSTGSIAPGSRTP